MLGSPHLVLSDAGRDDDVLLAVLLAPLVERDDDLLRLHELALGRLGRRKGERVRLLPFADLGEPLFTRGGRLGEEGQERAERVVDVADDGNVGVDDLVDVLRLDLKVDDATTALGSGLARGRCEGCSREQVSKHVGGE